MSDQLPLAMSPGSMLDGRYRLEVLLSEHGGARFWRATDTVLARSVAVHVVASTDPRAPAVLEAARTSARVTDPHFLRVLDCDDVDGITWVINEWGEGTSLDVMLAQGPLPPKRAAWLTREVAEAIAAAHAQGLHHGRLNPEAVLLTDSGAVKIIGFVVNAAFERTSAGDAGTGAAPYGVISDREADVIDLAGILYAALTVRWPGVAPSALAPAPREGNRPLRPRQVRAGIPRTLDAICDRVLHKEASQHVLPIETAHDIAAALSDYVGDPAAAAPVDVPSMHDDPETVRAPDETSAGLPSAPEPAVVPVVDPVEEPVLEPVADPGPEPVAEAEPEPEPAPEPAADPEPDEPAPDPTLDPDATMAAPPPFSPSGIELVEPEEWEPSAPPPPFEAPVARPLFAEEERRVPPGAPVVGASPDQAPGGWPFVDDEPFHPTYAEPRRRRTWPVVLFVLLLLAAVAVGAYLLYQDQQDADAQPAPRTSVTPSSAPPTVVTGEPIRIVRAGDFDPEGDPPEENPRQIPLAIDGKSTTAWKTSIYTQAPLGGLKSGVGLVLDLGSQQEIGSIEIQVIGTPTEMEFFATPAGLDDAPVELADADRLGAITSAGPTTLFRVEPATTTRYVIVWLTRLPAVERGFQGQIAEITVRS